MKKIGFCWLLSVFLFVLPAKADSWDTTCGNVNLDDDLNVLDIVALVVIILSGDNVVNQEGCNADINGDGTVNVLDIVAVVGKILNDNEDYDPTEDQCLCFFDAGVSDFDAGSSNGTAVGPCEDLILANANDSSVDLSSITFDQCYPSAGTFNFVGHPDDTVFMVDISASWCGPCQSLAGNGDINYIDDIAEFYVEDSRVRIMVALHDEAQPYYCVQWGNFGVVGFPDIISDPYYIMPLLMAGLELSDGSVPQTIFMDSALNIYDVHSGIGDYAAHAHEQINNMLECED